MSVLTAIPARGLGLDYVQFYYGEIRGRAGRQGLITDSACTVGRGRQCVVLRAMCDATCCGSAALSVTQSRSSEPCNEMPTMTQINDKPGCRLLRAAL